MLLPAAVNLTMEPPPRPVFIASPKATNISHKYDLLHGHVLGEGSFATVYSALHRDSGQIVAVKAIKRRYLTCENEKNCVEHEVNNMILARHSNIIRLHETYEDPDHIYLVMERAGLGNLEQILQVKRKLPEEEVQWVMRQLLQALDHLHGLGVVHLDVKAPNILFHEADGARPCPPASPKGGGVKGAAPPRAKFSSLSNSVLKLCDLGLSRQVSDPPVDKIEPCGVCGTGGFLPPEMYRKEPYGKPADMWSAGVLCYQLLSGTIPFIPGIKCLTHPVNFQSKAWEVVSDEAKEFIMGMLQVDQDWRMTAKEALAHKWLNKSP